MKLKAQVMDEAALNRALMRIAHEITEKNKKHLAHSMQSPAKRVCMEKEEGDCLVQLLPQGRSGTVQASSDETERRTVRRVNPC